MAAPFFILIESGLSGDILYSYLACNKYMYRKIENQMGIQIVPVKLFVINNKKINLEVICLRNKIFRSV